MSGVVNSARQEVNRQMKNLVKGVMSYTIPLKRKITPSKTSAFKKYEKKPGTSSRSAFKKYVKKPEFQSSKSAFKRYKK
jgi:hypothetical protein|tara:strand:- start:709 stop:945 length:237 start_codon:yes stop_codon:yes gene_type:complete